MNLQDFIIATEQRVNQIVADYKKAVDNNDRYDRAYAFGQLSEIGTVVFNLTLIGKLPLHDLHATIRSAVEELNVYHGKAIAA